MLRCRRKWPISRNPNNDEALAQAHLCPAPWLPLCVDRPLRLFGHVCVGGKALRCVVGGKGWTCEIHIIVESTLSRFRCRLSPRHVSFALLLLKKVTFALLDGHDSSMGSTLGRSDRLLDWRLQTLAEKRGGLVGLGDCRFVYRSQIAIQRRAFRALGRWAAACRSECTSDPLRDGMSVWTYLLKKGEHRTECRIELWTRNQRKQSRRRMKAVIVQFIGCFAFVPTLFDTPPALSPRHSIQIDTSPHPHMHNPSPKARSRPNQNQITPAR